MPAEKRELGGFPKTEHTPNPEIEEMSLDDLQKLVDWPQEFEKAVAREVITPEQPEESSEPEPEPEATPEPVEPEASTEPEPETEPEPVEEAPKEPSAEELEAEILRARFEALEAHTKKMEAKMAGREAGEKGYIKQLKAQIEELRSGAARQPDPDYGEPEPEIRRPQVTPAEPNSVTTWAINNAVQQAAAQFSQGHPDLQEVQESLQAYLQESGYDPQAILLTNDPIAAGRETTRVLEEAYWHAKAATRQSRVAELETKRADQVRGLENAKKKAAISGSGGTPPAPPVRKSTKDLSVAELEKQMDALGRR